jgi:hypothetical protein
VLPTPKGPFFQPTRKLETPISVISGISVSPLRHRLGLYGLCFRDNIGQEEVAAFIREVLHHLRGHVIALLDNSITHRGGVIRTLYQEVPRLHLEYFPPYAPELDPDERGMEAVEGRTGERESWRLSRSRNGSRLRVQTLGTFAVQAARMRPCFRSAFLFTFNIALFMLRSIVMDFSALVLAERFVLQIACEVILAIPSTARPIEIYDEKLRFPPAHLESLAPAVLLSTLTPHAGSSTQPATAAPVTAPAHLASPSPDLRDRPRSR